MISTKETSALTVALAGNPNCGKTTLFNALTGLRYKVANYPGVTVERKQGKLALDEYPELTLVDLPGIYSLDGSAIDEKIATSALLGEIASESVPNALVVVVDASNLERNLYLTTQIIDLGIPLIVALNMQDLAEKKGVRIYSELLSKALDVTVLPIQAHTQHGINQLRSSIAKLLSTPKVSSKQRAWTNSYPVLERELLRLAGRIGEVEGGTATANAIPISISNRDSNRDSDSATINQEFNQLQMDRLILRACHLLAEATNTTNKVVAAEVNVSREQLRAAGLDPLTVEATARYEWIHEIVKQVMVRTGEPGATFGEKIDRIITHRVWGTVFFFGIMTLIFQSIFLWAEAPMAAIESLFSWLGSWVGAHLKDGALKSLLVEGIIAGVGSVVIFVPQIAVLFFFLGLLEDSGYLARAAFLMDRIMRPFGLQGRSFIPLLSSFACAIPGIMSSRTIPSWADRLATILVAPLMSCSARLPVYTVLIAAFVPDLNIFGVLSLKGFVLLGMYLLGIIGAAVVSWLLKKTALRGKPALFVMEMPPIRRPMLKIVFREVFDRVLVFLRSAGTIILACSILLWFLASYPKPPAGYEGSKVKYSFAGQLGSAIEPAIRPLGFNWEIGVGIIASFAAREVFVSALSTVYNLENDDTDSSSLVALLRAQKEEGRFTTRSAISLMVFYVFACQCMSTLAVCRRETGSWGWTAFMFSYMTVLAYVSAFAAYNLYDPLLRIFN